MFAVRGDIWVGITIVVGVPKLFLLKSFQDLVCDPLPGVVNTGEQGMKHRNAVSSVPKVTIEGSLFLSNVVNYSPDEELTAVIAIEEVSLKLNTIIQDFRLFSAFAALRQNSQDPSCYPSGFFVSVLIGTDWGFGEGVKTFLTTGPKARTDIGITWNDAIYDEQDGNTTIDIDNSDFLQSIFIRG
mmetsp:Transcript_6646/g.14599  ORF Transcript_6646/g.14599 Transcript_6646/m.14599 type:complete len:185 (-) Transcript_6646:80-634(-)